MVGLGCVWNGESPNTVREKDSTHPSVSAHWHRKQAWALGITTRVPEDICRVPVFLLTPEGLCLHIRTIETCPSQPWTQRHLGKPHSWAPYHSCLGHGTSERLRLPWRPSFLTFYLCYSSFPAGVKGLPSAPTTKTLLDKDLFADFLVFCPESCVLLSPCRDFDMPPGTHNLSWQGGHTVTRLSRSFSLTVIYIYIYWHGQKA